MKRLCERMIWWDTSPLKLFLLLKDMPYCIHTNSALRMCITVSSCDLLVFPQAAETALTLQGKAWTRYEKVWNMALICLHRVPKSCNLRLEGSVDELPTTPYNVCENENPSLSLSMFPDGVGPQEAVNTHHDASKTSNITKMSGAQY